MHVIDSLDYTNKFIVVVRVCLCFFFFLDIWNILILFFEKYIKILFNKSLNAL